MAEIEFEVPGMHPPCRTRVWDAGAPDFCMSRIRAIRHVPKNMGKMLVCGNGHNQRGANAFIGGHEFDVGGEFDGIVPREFLPDERSMRNSRWKVPANAPIHGVESEVCIACKTPTYDMYAGPDLRASWPWLQTYAPTLAAEITGEMSQHPSVPFGEWTAFISDDLKRRVRLRLDKSRLDIEHSIPKSVGDDVWPFLIAPERAIIQATLLVRACRDCNLKKSKKLLLRTTIEQWYVETYFDGDRPAAMADARWNLIDRVLTKVYEQKAVG